MDIFGTWRLGRLGINPHPIFEFLAYGLAFQYYRRLRATQNDPLGASNRLWILMGGFLGGLLFSKSLGGMEATLLHPGNWHAGEWLAGKSVVGGLLGGLLGVELVKLRLGVRQSSGDLFCFPIILGMMIGRVGCFLAGLEDGTYGLPTHVSWGIDFGDGIPRHPTQLYDLIFLALLWIVLKALEIRLRPGLKFQLFLAAYLGYRFLVEFLKPTHTIAAGLSVLQIACLLGLIYYLLTWCFPGSFLDRTRYPDRPMRIPDTPHPVPVEAEK